MELESANSWTLFLERFCNNVTIDEQNVCINSYYHKGIKSASANVFNKVLKGARALPAT